MKLQEYQLKQYFKRYGISVPTGHVTSIAREAKQVAEEIGFPVVVKAQVLAEGRGMAGGIKLAKSPEETEKFAAEILASHINGLPVNKILVDEAIVIEKEYFLLITFDRAEKIPLLMMYESGSIYIESAANALYENLDRVYIDPLVGLQRYQVRELASHLDFPSRYLRELTEICLGLWQLFTEMDATLVAINPLAITDDQRLLALDGKVTLDDDAYFRQEALFDLQSSVITDPIEFEARKYGMAYIRMEGNIGCVMNGAGMAMACLDYIRLCGGEPANFLDLTICNDTRKVVTAMKLLYNDPRIQTVIVSVYGGMTHCDVVAEGLLLSQEENTRNIPTFARFSGTNAGKALEMLNHSVIRVAENMPEAVNAALASLGGKQ